MLVRTEDEIWERSDTLQGLQTGGSALSLSQQRVGKWGLLMGEDRKWILSLKTSDGGGFPW